MKGLSYPASGLSFRIELLVGETYVTCNVSQVSHKRAEIGRGFSAQLLGIIIFSIDSYYGDFTCSKSITKSFVMYLVNDI